MRVIVDPVASAPEHALTKSQIRSMLSVLPSDWTQPIRIVRLSNGLLGGPAADYSFISHRLNIHSRGRAVGDVIRDVITELLLHYSMTHPTPLWRLADSQRKRLNSEVEPLLVQALNAVQQA